MVINTDTRDGSLRAYASEKGIPMLLYEAGEALFHIARTGNIEHIETLLEETLTVEDFGYL